MKITARKLFTKVGLAALVVGYMTPAISETLVMSSWLPPKHPITTNVMVPWAEQVAEVTEGRVKVRILAKPLGSPPAHFDLAADGIADITYGLHSFTKDDRFLRSRIGQFSFLGDTAVETSLAFWDIYAGQLDAQAEHEGTKLLGLFLHGPGLFNNNQRKIETAEDFKGLKIRTPGGYIADLAGELGVVTQFMGPGEVFEKLSRGVIDGVTFPIEALKSFKLTDHISYAMQIPGGIYNTSFFLVMNEEKWDSLSDEDRAAIEGISGPAFAQLAGEAWDASDAIATAYIAEETSVVVHEASAEVTAVVREKAAAFEAAWIEEVGATGYDGAAALADFRAATAN